MTDLPQTSLWKDLVLASDVVEETDGRNIKLILFSFYEELGDIVGPGKHAEHALLDCG